MTPMEYIRSMRILNVWLAFMFAVTLAVSIQGCSGKKVDESDPAQLYADAEDDIKNDHYQIAIDKLRVIKNKFPYSKYATEAQLQIGDVYFMEESYGEAAAVYESFRDLHPKHEKIAYATFRIGKSYYKDIPDPIARDMTEAQKGLDAYNDFLKRFPGDANAEEARKDAQDIRSKLADKELYIANFYFKRDFFDSAKTRFAKIMDLYPDTPAAKEAQDKLNQISAQKKESSADARSKP